MNSQNSSAATSSNPATAGSHMTHSCVSSSHAPTSYTEQVQELAAALEPYLIEKRRFFHARPELSGKEVNTTAAIAAELDAIGVEYAYLPDFEHCLQSVF